MRTVDWEKAMTYHETILKDMIRKKRAGNFRSTPLLKQVAAGFHVQFLEYYERLQLLINTMSSTNHNKKKMNAVYDRARKLYGQWRIELRHH